MCIYIYELYVRSVCLSVGLYASNVIICDSNIICDVIKYNKKWIFDSYSMVNKTYWTYKNEFVLRQRSNSNPKIIKSLSLDTIQYKKGKNFV